MPRAIALAAIDLRFRNQGKPVATVSDFLTVVFSHARCPDGKLVATVSDFLTVVISSDRLTRTFRTGSAQWEKTTVRKSLTVATGSGHCET